MVAYLLFASGHERLSHRPVTLYSLRQNTVSLASLVNGEQANTSCLLCVHTDKNFAYTMHDVQLLSNSLALEGTVTAIDQIPDKLVVLHRVRPNQTRPNTTTKTRASGLALKFIF